MNGRSPPRAFVPETFRTSRLLDFSSRRELTAQIGHEPEWWPAVAAWYDLERFTRLFCALLNADRKVGQIRLVRDWIADFRVLSGTAKRKAIINDLGLARVKLEGLVEDGAPDRDKLERLLLAMQAAGTAPKGAALGIIGKEHLLERLQLGETGQESFEYRKLIDDDPLSPRITELAFAYDPETMMERRVLTGINHSPALLGANAFREVGYNTDSGLGHLLENHAVRQPRSRPASWPT